MGGSERCLPLCCVVFGGKTTAVEGVSAAVTVLVCLSRGARLHISSVNGECGGACRWYRADLGNIYIYIYIYLWPHGQKLWEKVKIPGMVFRHTLDTPGIFSNIHSPQMYTESFSFL